MSMTVWQTDRVTSEDSFCFVLNAGTKIGVASARPPSRRSLVHLDVASNLMEEMDLVRAAVEQHMRKIMQRTTDTAGDDLLSIAAIYIPIRRMEHQDASNMRRELPFATMAFLDLTSIPYILISTHLGFRASIFAAFASLLDIANLKQSRQARSARLDVPHFGGLSSHKTDILYNGNILPAYRR